MNTQKLRFGEKTTGSQPSVDGMMQLVAGANRSGRFAVDPHRPVERIVPAKDEIP